MTTETRETRPIFACSACGTQRVYGDALSQISHNDLPENREPRLLCDDDCTSGHVGHSYVGKASTKVLVERGGDKTIGVHFLFEPIPAASAHL